MAEPLRKFDCPLCEAAIDSAKDTKHYASECKYSEIVDLCSMCNKLRLKYELRTKDNTRRVCDACYEKFASPLFNRF